MDSITFFTNDRGAIRRARKYSIGTYDYSDFRNRMIEAGITVP